MTPPKPPGPKHPDATRDEQDEVARARALILQRRNRFIAAAIAGLGATNQACSDTHDPNAGSQTVDAGGDGGRGGVGARPSVCLSGRGGGGAIDAGPTEECMFNMPPPCVCLEPPFDAGGEEDGG